MRVALRVMASAPQAPRRSERDRGDERGPDQGRRSSQSGSRGTFSSDRPREKPVSLREVAVEQLRRIEEDGAYSGLVAGSRTDEVDTDVDRIVFQGGEAGGEEEGAGPGPGSQGKKQSFGGMLALTNPSDRRMCTQIVNGVTRWRLKLNWAIVQLTKRELKDIDPPILYLLRVALFELLFLRVPSYVINEHVEVTRQLTRKPYAPGFVNGVLRSALREGWGDGRFPELSVPGKSEAETLALTWSHPTWIVKRWLAVLGPEATASLLRSNNLRPRFHLRRNATLCPTPEELEAKLEEREIKFERSSRLPDRFLSVTEGLQAALPLVKEGLASVQDESGGLVVSMLDLQPGDTLVDCCSAPGGKALYAADLVGPTGRVLALDVLPGRVRAVENASRALGLQDRVTCGQADVLEVGRAGVWGQGVGEAAGGKLVEGIRAGGFPKVLLDVPCSGLGVLSKRADLRWRRNEAQMAELTTLQSDLLRSAATLVAPGGTLVYSTCSPDPEETTDRVKAFLKESGGKFVLERPPKSIPADCVTPQGFMLVWPHTHGVDGAFAARLKRVA